jgi:hypothetical protein
VQALEAILSCTRAEFDQWLATHGTAEALWAVVLVLRYLIACKERVKGWLGRLG